MRNVQGHTELTSQEARGGGRGRHLLMMLIVSVLATTLLMSAFWILPSIGH